MKKRKLSLFAKIFGNKYYIRIVEDMKEDEIVFIGHKLYIPANSILFNKGGLMKKRTLGEELIYVERDIVRSKNKPLKRLFFIWRKKKLERKWEREWLKK